VEARLPSEVQLQIQGVVNRLVDEFDPIVRREAIETQARRKLDEFRDARVVNFLPVLLYRYVREDLERIAS
jgi:hypothetical protein